MSLQFRNAQVGNGNTVTMQFDQAVTQTYAVLGGFSVGYGSSDHFIKTIDATLNTTGGPSVGPVGSVTVTATATISDDSGNVGGGSLYALGIGQSADDRTVFKDVSWQPGKDSAITMTIDRQTSPLDRAWVFVRGFKLTYGRQDHHVQSIAIDAGNTTLQWSSVAERGEYTWTITFTPSLLMQDNSGNKQDTSSTLRLLVMAAPTSDAPAA
jgi:hypothetical protein